VLDIDSPSVGRFDQDDLQGLQSILDCFESSLV